ncbi:hypothetical protein RugamoR57_17830 [Duganella caerulea]|uniref:hypothetical protein n=1 Tax=Duganella caerulea TaxID=2885762 RepID=UPI0030E7568C
MKRAYWFVIIHMTLVLLCIGLLNSVIAANGSPLHKFLAGFFIGTYALFGKETARLLITCLRKKKFPVFDSSAWVNGFTLVALVVLAMAGLIAWFVSWEGSTGLYFGLAVFSAALLSDEGLSPLVAEYSPV